MVHDNLTRLRLGHIEVFVHVWVELLDAAVNHHGWSLDAEVPGHLGTLLDVALKGFLLGSCFVDRTVFIPPSQAMLDCLLV